MGGSAQRTLAFAIGGPIERADLPELCARVCALLARHDPKVVLCYVAGVGADAVTVDALARLQLAAKRRGCRVYLCNAAPDLLELVSFMGLTHVLPCATARELLPEPEPGRHACLRRVEVGGSRRPPGFEA